MGALSLSSSLVLRHFLPPKPPSPPLTLLFKQPLSLSFPSTPLHTFFRSLSSLSQTNRQSPSASLTLETHENVVIEDDSESNSKETHVVETAVGEVGWDSSKKYQELVANLPSLSTKEKKELASYAHSLGKKLKSQQVGKGGVTDAVATALVETLEANELLKVKIHSNSPAELDDAVKQLEGATGSVAVGRIGRTVILYRPSLTKLKAEEKKLQARRVFVRRQQAYKSSLQILLLISSFLHLLGKNRIKHKPLGNLEQKLPDSLVHVEEGGVPYHLFNVKYCPRNENLMLYTQLNHGVHFMLSIGEVLQKNLQIQLMIMLASRSTFEKCHLSNCAYTSNVVLWLDNIL